MFKRILAAMLAALSMFSVAACSNDEPEVKDDETTAEEETAPAVYEGTLEELTTAIYEKQPVEAMMGPTTLIDLADTDALAYYIGVNDASNIKEASFSEPMIGSIPYSLCLVRVKEGADIAALQQSILEKVDTRKWMCVEADNLVVASGADIILMVMTKKEMSETLSQDLAAAFEAVLGTEVTKLAKK